MLRNLTIVMLVVFTAACGGRVAQPVTIRNAFDERLSCAHLRGEIDNNNKRLEELVGERSEAVASNFGYLVTSPLFLDLSTTRKREAEALTHRNERLAALMTDKGCDAENGVSAATHEAGVAAEVEMSEPGDD